MQSSQWSKYLNGLLVLVGLILLLGLLAPQVEAASPIIQPAAFPARITIASLGVGEFHTCAVKTDGTLACWGAGTTNAGSHPDYGQSIAPTGTFTQVSGGSFHTCAVKTDGTLACWGAGTAKTGILPDLGQAAPPVGTFTQVSSGGLASCAVKTDGTLACWGDNSLGQVTPPAGTFTQVSVAWQHTCGIRTDGTIACWGDNSFGQATPPAGTFIQVSAGAGGTHTCAVKTNGTLACWGDNSNGRATPPAGTFSQVSSGDFHTCGIRANGTLACWGLNEDGQTLSPAGTFTYVGAGAGHSCAVKTNGTLACWGRNDHEQATPPAGSFNRPLVSAGTLMTCGIKPDGTIACWGYDKDGWRPPPDGTFTQISVGFGLADTYGVRTDGTLTRFAGAAPPTGTFTQVSAGGRYKCGIKSDSTLVCWGFMSGETLPPTGTFTQVSAGHVHACALRTDSTIACWGGEDHNVGQTEAPDGTFTQVSAGGYSCGIRTDGTVACWGGFEWCGKVACGPKIHQVPSGTFTQISTGDHHTCGIMSNGTLACWGDNDFGEATPPDGIFTQVSAGHVHTCGVKADGTVVCWGSNGGGEAPGVVVNPETLPNGTVSTAYNQTFSGGGGTAPYTFAVIAGALPPGLALDEALGVLSGTPSTAGAFEFTIQTSDSNAMQSFTGQRDYSLNIDKGTTNTVITSHSPHQLIAGETVTVAFAVNVGVPGSGTPTGNVTVSDGVDSCVASVAVGTCNITLHTVGTRTIVATYAGDANFNPSVSAGEDCIVYPTACAGKPRPPQLVEPEDGTATKKRGVKLDWNNVVCADMYRVVIKLGSPSGDIVQSKRVTDSKLTTKPLTPGEKYVWRVRARNEIGWGKWSKWWDFTVAANAR